MQTKTALVFMWIFLRGLFRLTVAFVRMRLAGTPHDVMKAELQRIANEEAGAGEERVEAIKVRQENLVDQVIASEYRKVELQREAKDAIQKARDYHCGAMKAFEASRAYHAIGDKGEAEHLHQKGIQMSQWADEERERLDRVAEEINKERSHV